MVGQILGLCNAFDPHHKGEDQPNSKELVICSLDDAN